MSMLDHILAADVFVSSVQFSEEAIEMTFLEQREQGTDVAIMRSMLVKLENSAPLQEAFLNLQELLCDVVDEGYHQLRNPQEGLSLREQMAARRAAAAVGEDPSDQ